MKTPSFEKAIIFAIAINQLLLSLIFLEIALVYGLSPFLAILGLWGLINAFALFSSSVLPRAGAFFWHLLFVGYVFVSLISGPHQNASDRFIVVWAVIDLAAILYLGKSLLEYHRNKPTRP